MSGEVRILLAGLLWFPLLEPSTNEFVTLLTEDANFSQDSFRLVTCQMCTCDKLKLGVPKYPCKANMGTRVLASG